MTDIVGVTTPSLVGLNGKPIVAKDKEPEVPVEDRAKQLPEAALHDLLPELPVLCPLPQWVCH